MKQNMKYGVVIAVALIAGAGASAWKYGLFGSAASPSVSAPVVVDMWKTPLKEINGKPASLAAYKGKPLVVNFWASWCGPCREEMPEFVAAQKEAGDKVRFVGVAIDNPLDVEKFLKEIPVNYPVLLGEQPVMDLMRSEGNKMGVLPFTAIYDATGKRIATHPGRLTREQLQQYLKPLTPV